MVPRVVSPARRHTPYSLHPTAAAIEVSTEGWRNITAEMDTIEHVVSEGFLPSQLQVRRRLMAEEMDKSVPDAFFGSVFDNAIIDDLYKAISQHFLDNYNSSTGDTRRKWRSFSKHDHTIAFFAHFVLRPVMACIGTHDAVRTASLAWIKNKLNIDLLDDNKSPLLITNAWRFASWYAALNTIAGKSQLWLSVLENVQKMVLTAVTMGSLAAIDETLVFATHGEFNIHVDEDGVIHLPVIMHIPRKPKSTFSCTFIF